MSLDRRTFLASSLAAFAPAVAGTSLAAQPRLALTVDRRTLEVDGRAASVFKIEGPNGRSGLVAAEGERLVAELRNASADPLVLHWHGQTRAAADQDRARPGGGALAAGTVDLHDFELTPGTHWMHSHTLTEQQLLAAPMIVREADAGEAEDVVVMLHDFSFRSPEELLAELGATSSHGGGGAGHGAHGGHVMHGRAGPAMIHANDVRYDAFLANDRSLRDPQVVRVERGGRVRLRLINGATATAFLVDTGGLEATVVAVDGTRCAPVTGRRFPIAQGQRLDILATIPAAGGAFPILAQVEDETRRTGIVLATAGAPVERVSERAGAKAPVIDLSFEARLRAAAPLPAVRPARSYRLMLGEQPGYRWTINGAVHGQHRPLEAKRGERVEITFMNPTAMSHPMHLHGHHFQVVGIGHRARFAGAVRDVIVVPPHTPVTIAFDANLPGEWYLHCHHLYHMAGGMMTELNIA